MLNVSAKKAADAIECPIKQSGTKVKPMPLTTSC